jgi:FixJ family two-component response regulator
MTKTIKIIHLEDSKFDAEIIERELKISALKFELIWVSNKQDFRKALQTTTPDLILSDHSLPAFSSMEALKMMAEMDLSIPFILITGAISEEFAVNILKEGASDYLLKDKMKRLPEAITDCLQKWESRKKEKENLSGLMENEHRLSLMMDHLTHGVMMLDNDLRIIYKNAACRPFTGPLTETRELSLGSLLDRADLEKLKTVIQDLSPGESRKIKIRLSMRPGSDSTQETHLTQLPGQSPEYMLQFQDTKPELISGF